MAERSIREELQDLYKKGLTSKKVIILKGPLESDSPVTEQHEGSIIDEEGLKEVTISEISYAPACHHLIHTEAELGAVCVVCGQAMCDACSSRNLCTVCGRAVCKRDQKSIEHVGMVCGLCKREWFRKQVISSLLTAAMLGALIYLVLRFIQ